MNERTRILSLDGITSEKVFEFVRVGTMYEIRSSIPNLELNVPVCRLLPDNKYEIFETSDVQITDNKLLCLRKVQIPALRGGSYPALIFMDETGLIFRLRLDWITRQYRPPEWTKNSEIIEL